jgi:hypothetical protein
MCMTDRIQSGAPAILTADRTAEWEEGANNPPVPTLTALQLSILRRVAQGQGLFRLLDENLKPVYDFGPNEPAETDAVEELIRTQAIQFHSALGYRLPMKAQLTAWGKAFLEDAADR